MYVDLSDMYALIPEAFLVQGLDDTQSGAVNADVWAQVAQTACDEIDGYLSARYAVPFDAAGVPPLVATAARVFAAEIIYRRRGLDGDKNPFAKQAAEIRSRLNRIARGEEALSVEISRAKPSISIITSPARTVHHA